MRNFSDNRTYRDLLCSRRRINQVLAMETQATCAFGVCNGQLNKQARTNVVCGLGDKRLELACP